MGATPTRRLPPWANRSQARRDSNPQPPVLETGALPVELRTFAWPGAESNRRHHDFQSCALPTELPGRKKSARAGLARAGVQRKPPVALPVTPSRPSRARPRVGHRPAASLRRIRSTDASEEAKARGVRHALIPADALPRSAVVRQRGKRRHLAALRIVAGAGFEPATFGL